jgi:hypothetical protein
MGGDWGHVKAAGVLRQVGFQSTLTPDNNPSGTKTGYGLNLTGTLKVFGKDQINGVSGQGHRQLHERWRVDYGARADHLGSTSEAVQSLGWLAYCNHRWSDQWSSTIGFRSTNRTTPLARLTAFRTGSYGNLNLLYTR